MDYRRRMRLMQDLYKTKEEKTKEYLTARVRKGSSGKIASTSMRDRLKSGGKEDE